VVVKTLNLDSVFDKTCAQLIDYTGAEKNMERFTQTSVKRSIFFFIKRPTIDANRPSAAVDCKPSAQ